MQILSQFRKPSSPLKQTHPICIISQLCVPIGYTSQEVGSFHPFETTLHSLQQTYIRPLIHTTQTFKCAWYTLTTLNISQLQTFDVPQGGVLSPTLFYIYTSDLPPPSAPVQVMAYAEDITITSTHTSTNVAKKYIQPYIRLCCSDGAAGQMEG